MRAHPVTVSVRVAGYYANLKTDDNASGSLIAFPLSLFASFRLQDRIWLHTEGAYVYARAFGAGDLDQVHFGGAVATQAVQLGGVLELRLTRIFSLTATGRYQVYTADLAFEGSGNVDPYTTANVNGRAVGGGSAPLGGDRWRRLPLEARSPDSRRRVRVLLPSRSRSRLPRKDDRPRRLAVGDPVRRLFRFAIVSLAVAALTTCVSKLDIPTPPMQAETQAIAADYEMPSGSVEHRPWSRWCSARSNAKLPNLELDWLPNLASNLLSSLDERLQQSGLPDNPDASIETHHFILSAVVDVHRICDGFDNPPGPRRLCQRRRSTPPASSRTVVSCPKSGGRRLAARPTSRSTAGRLSAETRPSTGR